MKRDYKVPPETLANQAKASNPRHSVWVSANAGSGKTHVLSQRVIRLLLDGADPSRLLCLTYTRAAAANMSNRVFASLSQWTTLDDGELAERIVAIGAAAPDADTLRRARRLFARALETPGGLKIQTIHAFCESVLHQFPLEANVAANFQLLDPLMEAALFADARRELLTGVMGPETPEHAEAFATVLDRGGETGLQVLLTAIIRNRDGVRAFIEAARDGGAAPYGDLFEEFHFQPGENAETIAASVWPLPGFEPSYFGRLPEAARVVGAGRTLELLLPSAMLAFAETEPLRRLELLVKGFLKVSGEPYANSWIFGKPLLSRMPDLADRYVAACAAIAEVSDRLAMFRTLEATRAALIIADWLIARYEQLKSGRAFVDFNDLITRTVRLLARQDAGAWVQYKLDKGIDHILLDEAQDTSPDQWEVVKSLTGEFFDGSGARDDVERTVFAVGDEKQSIYSFQGAAPESFARTGLEFAQKVSDAQRSFHRVGLSLSFRSTEDVLRAVDRVFSQPDAARGLTFEGNTIFHEAIRAGAPGYVELWPTVGAEAVEEPDDWREPIDHAKASVVKVAENIAATIDGWLKSREIIEAHGRPLSPGDVLVLVRKRDNFVNALSRSLKSRQIPVAGADRLSLSGHIAVQDMIALGRFLIQPEDDLSLAAVLRSPVFGFGEEALYDLAANRGVKPLGASLRDRAATDLECNSAAKRLADWASEAAFERPFEFYSGVLGRDGVRARMIARLGPEAGDMLDEFLNFCLAQEKTGLPGLEAFLATLQSAAPEIKREMDQRRDEVRIMTVHAAKGLEAPVVFLVDGGADPFSNQHQPRLIPFRPKGTLSHVKGFLWRVPGEKPPSFVRQVEASIAASADDEYRRLLYVGMTRAEDRLIVCGYYNKQVPKPSTWHAIVHRALGEAAETQMVEHPGLAEPVYRFRVTGDVAAASRGSEKREEPAPPPTPFPPALRLPLPASEELPRPLAPSGAAALMLETEPGVISGRSPVLDADAEPGFAISRGLAVHKMLQMLPSLPDGERDAAAGRYLDRVGGSWVETERRTALEAVSGILRHDAFRPLFAPGSRAEVAIMGHLEIRGKARAISGKIDRLALTPDAILIVDYKTSRPVPETLDAVPEAYVMQLALYRALLGQIYPGRSVSASLLFTDGPRLIEVPAAAMDACLARLTGA